MPLLALRRRSRARALAWRPRALGRANPVGASGTSTRPHLRQEAPRDTAIRASPIIGERSRRPAQTPPPPLRCHRRTAVAAVERRRRRAGQKSRRRRQLRHSRLSRTFNDREIETVERTRQPTATKKPKRAARTNARCISRRPPPAAPERGGASSLGSIEREKKEEKFSCTRARSDRSCTKALISILIEVFSVHVLYHKSALVHHLS